MDLIKPTCRETLSGQDRSFLLDVLGGSGPRRAAVDELLCDPETRDVLLDEVELLQALLDLPQTLSVSLQLYLYVLLRHVFLRNGLDDREVTDYIASMLCGFRRTARLTDYRTGSEQVVECIADLEASAESFGEPGSFYIRVYIGNLSLFLTGLFPQRIQFRKDRWGAPGLPYYSGKGRSNYQIAGHHGLARKEGLSRTYHVLASDFLAIQATLHEVCERYLFLNQPGGSVSGLSA